MSDPPAPKRSQSPITITRRHLLVRTALVGVLGAEAGFIFRGRLPEIVDALTDDSDKKPSQDATDRRDYAFVPVILSPGDRPVTDADIAYIRSIIDSANTKLFDEVEQTLRFDPVSSVINTPQPASALSLRLEDLRPALDETVLPALQITSNNNPAKKYVIFYLGELGIIDGTLDNWLGVAMPGRAINYTYVLANPNFRRENEDRVLLHESFHLLGVGHTDDVDLPGDLMNPYVYDGDMPVSIDPSYHGNVAPGNVDTWTSCYMAGSGDVETQMDRAYRDINPEALGKPSTGVMPIGDRRFIQYFDYGALSYTFEFGAFAVQADFFNAWDLDQMGLPTSTQHLEGQQMVQSFEKTSLSRAATTEELEANQQMPMPSIAPPS